MHHASKNSPLFPSYPMTKKVNSSLRANGGETHTLKISIRVWKKNKNNFIYFWLSPFLSVVYQWVLRSQAHIFWAPCLCLGHALAPVAEATCRHEPVLMGRHLVWCRGILGVPDSFTQLPFLFFWGSTERGMGSCRQVLWRPAFELSWKDVTVSTDSL